MSGLPQLEVGTPPTDVNRQEHAGEIFPLLPIPEGQVLRAINKFSPLVDKLLQQQRVLVLLQVVAGIIDNNGTFSFPALPIGTQDEFVLEDYNPPTAPFIDEIDNTHKGKSCRGIEYGWSSSDFSCVTSIHQSGVSRSARVLTELLINAGTSLLQYPVGEIRAPTLQVSPENICASLCAWSSQNLQRVYPRGFFEMQTSGNQKEFSANQELTGLLHTAMIISRTVSEAVYSHLSEDDKTDATQETEMGIFSLSLFLTLSAHGSNCRQASSLSRVVEMCAAFDLFDTRAIQEYASRTCFITEKALEARIRRLRDTSRSTQELHQRLQEGGIELYSALATQYAEDTDMSYLRVLCLIHGFPFSDRLEEITRQYAQNPHVSTDAHGVDQRLYQFQECLASLDPEPTRISLYQMARECGLTHISPLDTAKRKAEDQIRSFALVTSAADDLLTAPPEATVYSEWEAFSSRRDEIYLALEILETSPVESDQLTQIARRHRAWLLRVTLHVIENNPPIFCEPPRRYPQVFQDAGIRRFEDAQNRPFLWLQFVLARHVKSHLSTPHDVSDTDSKIMRFVEAEHFPLATGFTEEYLEQIVQFIINDPCAHIGIDLNYLKRMMLVSLWPINKGKKFITQTLLSAMSTNGSRPELPSTLEHIQTVNPWLPPSMVLKPGDMTALASMAYLEHVFDTNNRTRGIQNRLKYAVDLAIRPGQRDDPITELNISVVRFILTALARGHFPQDIAFYLCSLTSNRPLSEPQDPINVEQLRQLRDCIISVRKLLLLSSLIDFSPIDATS